MNNTTGSNYVNSLPFSTSENHSYENRFEFHTGAFLPDYRENLPTTHNVNQEPNKRIQVLSFQNDKVNQENNSLKGIDNNVIGRIGNWTAKDPYQGPMDNLYFPFGSAGGGAPNRDSCGNLQTIIYGEKTLNRTKEEKEKKVLASQLILESLKHEILEQRLRRLQDKQQIREPQSNILESISSLKVGQPKRDPKTGMLIDNHHYSSDVTNNKLTTPRSSSPIKSTGETITNREDYSKFYGLELFRAAEERQILRKIEKLKDQQEVRQHINSWDQIWGRELKTNYVTPTNITNSYSNKSQHSNHKNFYELSEL